MIDVMCADLSESIWFIAPDLHCVFIGLLGQYIFADETQNLSGVDVFISDNSKGARLV